MGDDVVVSSGTGEETSDTVAIFDCGHVSLTCGAVWEMVIVPGADPADLGI